MEAEQLPQGASFFRTCFNGFNALSGIGILSVPYALSAGGWLSFLLLMTVAAICCYTGLLLRRCIDSNRQVRTYPDVGALAFGRKGRVAVSVLMYLELYLASISFLIVEGDNMDKLFPGVRFDVVGIRIAGKQGFVLAAALVILPTTWLGNLGVLAYVSLGGVLASLLVVGCVLWAGAVDGVGFHERGTLLNWSGVPTAVSLYLFCYGGHAVFPTIYNSMKNKNSFSTVLFLCFLLSTLNYGLMAILGYLMYGSDLKSQVTLNLPSSKLSSKVAIYTTLINPLTKYALLITPIATAIEDRFELSKWRSISILVRTLLVISTVVAALALPFFGSLVALTGSFLITSGSILLPCMCYLKIFKRSSSQRWWEFESTVVVAIILMGVLVAVMGTYSSLKQIINNL